MQKSNIERFIKFRQVGGEIDPNFPIVLGLVPWRHQVNIITKCKSIDEVVFYLRECILCGWNRQTLDNSLKANLYKVQGKAISIKTLKDRTEETAKAHSDRVWDLQQQLDKQKQYEESIVRGHNNDIAKIEKYFPNTIAMIPALRGM